MNFTLTTVSTKISGHKQPNSSEKEGNLEVAATPLPYRSSPSSVLPSLLTTRVYPLHASLAPYYALPPHVITSEVGRPSVRSENNPSPSNTSVSDWIHCS